MRNPGLLILFSRGGAEGRLQLVRLPAYYRPMAPRSEEREKEREKVAVTREREREKVEVRKERKGEKKSKRKRK